MTKTVDPANEYAWRTIILGGESDGDDYDPEEEAYWESLLIWMDENHA